MLVTRPGGLLQRVETLLGAFGGDRWCLLADADEHFVYPFVEEPRIASLCSYFESLRLMHSDEGFARHRAEGC